MTDQRHRYECDPCDSRGPLRDTRDQAARDAQQHDIGFHDGTLTCEVVEETLATDGGVSDPAVRADRRPCACPECGYEGSFDGQGKRTECFDSYHPKKGECEVTRTWYQHRCPDCGGLFRTCVTEERDFVDGGPEILTDGGEEFPYDSWFEAVQALGRQFEAENDDLEVTLEGSLGFVSLFTDEPPADVTRGVVTAMHQAVYETIEAVSVDEEYLEMHYGEVTPEAAAEAVLDQIDEYQYVSDPLRSNIRERVEARVHHNMDKRVEADR